MSINDFVNIEHTQSRLLIWKVIITIEEISSLSSQQFHLPLAQI